MEIDFLIVEPYENAAMKYRVSPIEVKSSKRYRTVSLDKFKTKFDKKVGTRYVLHPKPLVVEMMWSSCRSTWQDCYRRLHADSAF